MENIHDIYYYYTAIASALGLLSLLFKILKTPIKLALNCWLTQSWDFVLVVVNLLGSFIGISLG